MRRKRNALPRFLTSYLVSKNGKALGIWEGYTPEDAIKIAKQFHGSGQYEAINDPIKTTAFLLTARENAAINNFVENVVEQFGLTPDEALLALQAYIRTRVVKLDRPMSRYKLVAGDFWEKPVLLRAVKSQREYMAKQQTKRKRNKTIIKADRIDHVDVAKVHNPRRGTRWFGGKAGLTASARAFDSPRAMELRDLIEREVYTPQEFEEFSRLFERINKQSKRQKGKRKGLIPRAFGARRNAEGWRNEYEGAFNSIIFGTRHKKVIDLGRRKRGAERDLVMSYADDLLQLTMKNVAALDDGGLLAELSSKARTSAKRKHKVDPTRAALLLDQAEEIMLGGRRNPAEKDAEHPIEVTRHFRGGPPGYLSPWQKAMAIGQQELFDTGIKLAPRAAELRAARLSNPGATKPVYQSGLKQATAGQLPRLARVGLRVGRTPAEIRSDLATTGRFSAEQIRRAIDQATTAERRSNPPVREIFETFNGRPATRATSVEAPRRTPARVAQLGRLRLIRTADGRTWRFPGDRAPFLAADSRGKLHVVGGQYRANPAGEECGEIEQIEYQTSKPHLGHDNETIYYHQLGEETGERPILEITPEGELQIIGGNYRIEADGIHN